MVDRKSKLAEKLRENLRQRKSQQKTRKTGEAETSTDATGTSAISPERNHKDNIEPTDG